MELQNLLTQHGILINDVENVKKKIISIQKGACKKLQLVSDFDYTLTHCFDKDGRKLLSSYGAVEFDSRFPEKFCDQLLELYYHYSPIDADPTIEQEMKVQLIEEWNKKATEVYKSERITKEVIRNAVAEARLKLRGGFNQLVETFSSKDIPFLILSAGLGDSIDCVLENAGIKLDKIKIVANYFIFDDKKLVNGLTKPLIATGSKGKHIGQAHAEYFASVQDRKNVILLGDRIEDLQMAVCYGDSCDTLLTIGYLNEKVDEQKDIYLQKYDIVLLGDPDLCWIQKLINLIQ